MSDTSYTNTSVTRKPGSSVEIAGEIPVDTIARDRDAALARLSAELELDGFRRGHVPKEVAAKHLGEQKILEESAERLISTALGGIIQEHELDIVGRPDVRVNKLAPGNPIEFTVTAALYPEVTLPKYRTIASEIVKNTMDPEKVEVTDKEFENQMLDLRTRLAQKPQEEGAPAETPEPIELTDELVKQLGDFENVEDFKTKMRAQMQREKVQKEYEKRRLAIADKVIAETKVEVPDLFIESELDKMLQELEANVTRMGVSLEDYLTHAKKAPEDLRKDWRSEAEKRAKLQLVLTAIAKKEELKPEEERVVRETAHIMEHYPDATEASVHSYVTAMLTNEEVFKLLETRE